MHRRSRAALLIAALAFFARLANADGLLDTTFLNGLTGPNGRVFSFAVEPDGHVAIGGFFTTVNGVSRSRIARLNADGSLDSTFLDGLAGAGNDVFAVAIQPDRRVLIGGFFTTVNGVSSADEGNYSVVVSNALGSDTSLDVALTVAAVPECKVATCDPALGCVLVDAPVPDDVNSVLGSKSGVTATFDWGALSGANAYDVLRGAVRDLPVGSSPATETCFGDVQATATNDATVPTDGEGFWYLVRAENACGNGGYGSQASNGVPTAPRLSGTCP